MLREDLSTRFDYLFEPLETEESAGDSVAAATAAVSPASDEGRWSRWILLSGIVLATLVAAAGTAVVMLQPARPAQVIVIPTDATPLSTPMSTAASPAMPAPATTEEPVPVLPATVSTTVQRAPTVTPTPAPPPAPPAPPAPVVSPSTASAPPATMPPTTRAPISVSPETRTPFPNQNPPRKNDDGGGGLLGGLGGIL